MKNNEQITALKRAIYILRVAKKYLKENDYEEGTLHYDATECDGYCLCDDLEDAAENLVHHFGVQADEA